MYGSVKKIQRSEEVAVPLTFCLCQYSLRDDLIKVFMLVVIENAIVIEQSKAY